MKIINIIFLFFFIQNNLLIAQPNHTQSETIIFKPSEKQEKVLDISPKKEAFSISFWFQVLDNNSYPLLYQTRIQNSGQKDEKVRFVEVGVGNNSVYLKQTNGKNTEKPIGGKHIEKWHLLNYVYDGNRNISVYVDGIEVANLPKTSICLNIVKTDNETINFTNSIVLGKGNENNFLQGAISKLKVEQKILTEEEIKLNLKNRPTAKIQPKDFQTTVGTKQVNSEKNRHTFTKTKGRINIVRDTIKVSSTSLKLELWDYDEYDKDKIDIYINNSSEDFKNIELPKKNKKTSIEITINSDQENELLIFASNLGEWDVQNTAGINIYEIDEQGKKKLKNPKDKNGNSIPYALVCTADTNAVFKIIHESKKDGETINAGKTNTQDVILEISSDIPNILSHILVDSLKTNYEIKERKKLSINKYQYTLKLEADRTSTITIETKRIINVPSNTQFKVSLINAKTEILIYNSTNNNRIFPFKNNYTLNLELEHTTKNETISEINTVEFSEIICSIKNPILEIVGNTDEAFEIKSVKHNNSKKAAIRNKPNQYNLNLLKNNAKKYEITTGNEMPKNAYFQIKNPENDTIIYTSQNTQQPYFAANTIFNLPIKYMKTENNKEIKDTIDEIHTDISSQKINLGAYSNIKNFELRIMSTLRNPIEVVVKFNNEILTDTILLKEWCYIDILNVNHNNTSNIISFFPIKLKEGLKENTIKAELVTKQQKIPVKDFNFKFFASKATEPVHLKLK
ncbi:MAG: LamG-like jellyroll fold domain-containing protein [Chitinophagales bacterium]